MIARTLLTAFLGRVRAGRIEIAEGDRRLALGPPDAPLHAAVTVHDPSFWRAMTGGSRGLAESYALGVWDCDDLVTLVRIASREGAPARTASRAARPDPDALTRVPRNTREAAPGHIAAHYDISATTSLR